MPSDNFLKALNSLDVLREIDLVLVPQRAHKDMIKAGAQAAGVSDIQAMIVYEAMLQKALFYPIEERPEKSPAQPETAEKKVLHFDIPRTSY